MRISKIKKVLDSNHAELLEAAKKDYEEQVKPQNFPAIPLLTPLFLKSLSLFSNDILQAIIHNKTLNQPPEFRYLEHFYKNLAKQDEDRDLTSSEFYELYKHLFSKPDFDQLSLCLLNEEDPMLWVALTTIRKHCDLSLQHLTILLNSKKPYSLSLALNSLISQQGILITDLIIKEAQKEQADLETTFDFYSRLNKEACMLLVQSFLSSKLTNEQKPGSGRQNLINCQALPGLSFLSGKNSGQNEDPPRVLSNMAPRPGLGRLNTK